MKTPLNFRKHTIIHTVSIITGSVSSPTQRLTLRAVSSSSVEVNWTQPVSVSPQYRVMISNHSITYTSSHGVHTTTLPHHNMWLHQQWTRAHTYTWSSVVSRQTPLTPAVCLHTLNLASVRVCVTLSSQQVCQRNYSNYDSTAWCHNTYTQSRDWSTTTRLMWF